jgi:hypothetical protein
VQQTVWEGTSYSNTTKEPIAFPLDKTDGQMHERNVSLLSVGEGQNTELKKSMCELGDSAAPVEKVQHCTALEKLGVS